MPATAEPPVAPTPTVTPTQPLSLAPSQPKVIHVTPESITPTAPPKPGSARERMYQDLRKRAKPVEGESSTPPVTPPQKPTPSAEPSKAEGSEPPESGSSGNETPAPPSTAEGAHPATETPSKPRVSPWKLVDEWKGRAAEAERRLAEATKGIPSEDQKKAMAEEMQRKEARLKELEDEIRYVNYSKSEEFKTKYQEPYEKAWSRAMNELKEITITDSQNGTSRALNPGDLLELVNMPLGKAREAADQLFGPFADDVMAHRKEIRGLFEAQNAAMEEARKNGATREQQRADQFKQMQAETSKLVSDTWTKANEAATKDEKYGKYFTPVEGDEEGNQRLSKGFELVDKAFGENAFAPNLKPEDRAAIVRRHAAVRNRAAAFGRLVLQLSKKEAELAEARKELEQLKGSTPPTGGGAPPTEPAAPASAMEQVRQGLRKIAR